MFAGSTENIYWLKQIKNVFIYLVSFIEDRFFHAKYNYSSKKISTLTKLE